MNPLTNRLVRVDGVDLELAWLAAPAAEDGHSSRAPLVFLHEGLGSVALWRDWPAQLCARLGRAGLVYSRQGYGRSAARADVRGHGRLQPDYMHREALQVLPALLRELGIARPVLVGHSDGGTIALLHAAHHAVSACIVMAPHVVVEDISVRAIEAAREAYEHGPLRARLAAFHADVDNAFWQWNDVWLSEAFRSYDIRGEISAIAAPLLAIQGEDDPYGTMAQIEDIAAAVPHTQLLQLSACGHSPHRDQREAVEAAIADFLSRARTG